MMMMKDSAIDVRSETSRNSSDSNPEFKKLQRKCEEVCEPKKKEEKFEDRLDFCFFGYFIFRLLF